MIEPIVSRDLIFRRAEVAVLRSQPLALANPYPADSAAHIEFVACYEACEEVFDGLEA